MFRFQLPDMHNGGPDLFKKHRSYIYYHLEQQDKSAMDAQDARDYPHRTMPAFQLQSYEAWLTKYHPKRLHDEAQPPSQAHDDRAHAPDHEALSSNNTPATSSASSNTFAMLTLPVAGPATTKVQITAIPPTTTPTITHMWPQP